MNMSSDLGKSRVVEIEPDEDGGEPAPHEIVDVPAAIRNLLVAIAEGYPVEVEADRWIIVENPAFESGLSPWDDPALVLDTWTLRSSPTPPGVQS